MEDVLLGLPEGAVARVVRENEYSIVPPPGVVRAAVRKVLGDPRDVRAASKGWKERLWARVVKIQG